MLNKYKIIVFALSFTTITASQRDYIRCLQGRIPISDNVVRKMYLENLNKVVHTNSLETF